jgi:hypothetical protein
MLTVDHDPTPVDNHEQRRTTTNNDEQRRTHSHWQIWRGYDKAW